MQLDDICSLDWFYVSTFHFVHIIVFYIITFIVTVITIINNTVISIIINNYYYYCFFVCNCTGNINSQIDQYLVSLSSKTYVFEDKLTKY